MVPGLAQGDLADVRDIQVAFSPRGNALSLILTELRQARQSVDVAAFYLSHGDLIDALCRKAGDRGVRVRMLADAEAARPADRAILERLARHGVQVRILPLSGAKMHLKCAVVDGATVITGAANWTPEAFERNIEDTLVLRSADLARHYQKHFDELFARAQPLEGAGNKEDAKSTTVVVIRALSPTAERALPEKAASTRAEAFFTPGREGSRRLAEQIALATGEVCIAMYLLNDSAMRQAVAEKARSVPVRLMVDAGMLEGSLRPVLQELAEAGVEITWWGGARGSLHLKTAVIDERYVWTGSANWTVSAFDRNVEDMLLIDSPDVATLYLQFFDSIRKETQTFRPVGQVSLELGLESPSIRDGFLLGLPPTGPRTNWSRALGKQPLPSFETSAAVQYLPDDRYFPVLIELLRTARQSVLAAMFVFTEPKNNETRKAELVKALTAAAKRGVYVSLVLHMPPGEGEALARAHEDWAERLRAQGVDVRLHVPTVPLHAKCVVVDLAKVLIGSHNWTEGALSGERIYESSALLVLSRPDRRWADLLLGLETVSDMRSRAHWEEELRCIRQLSGLRGKSQDAYLRQLEGAP